jgi:transketolase
MLYLILKKRGYKIDPEKLLVHPEIDIDAGIEASTGSLGHGLPIGVGMALAAKMNDQNYRVFVLVGDGECQEGSIWESVMFACRMKLDNLFIIVDSNKYQALDRVDNILNMSPLENKFRAFGCSTISIDGHSFESIDGIFKVNDAPAVIIANTIKGNGISFMLNNPLWHYRGLTEDEYRQGLKELESC